MKQSSKGILSNKLDTLWKELGNIPPGKVSTYKAMAKKLKIKNPRLVGWMLKKNTQAPLIPCHRIIQSSLRIGALNE
jgi:methylated-DNA-[protein]-cysteine S-methyltransferase